jgi:predicted metal-binding protein
MGAIMGRKEELEAALKGQVWEYADISTADLVFSPELYKACEANRCGNYNRNWVCPPVAGTLEAHRQKILSFSRAFVFTTRYELEDSFDIEGMGKARELHNALTGEIHRKFGKTNPVYGAGACRICENCAYPEPCRFPDSAFSPVEAAGIDVTGLSRTGGLKYNNGPNTVTYFSMVLF